MLILINTRKKSIMPSFIFIMFMLFIAIIRANAGNIAVPGDLVSDAPTIHSLGFRWLLQGDDNGNTRVETAYRKKGDEVWHEALPMLRVHGEKVDRQVKPYTCAEVLAGSVMNLTPDTAYEMRLSLNDPDGASAVKIVAARTRPVPAMLSGDRQLYIYPVDYVGEKLSPAYKDLTTAAQTARPGDVVILHAGTYKGAVKFSVSGETNRPITFRGEPGAVIDGENTSGNIIDAQGLHDIRFENLTIRNGRMALKVNNTSRLVVRGCTIEDVEYGVISYSVSQSGWFVTDNVITGRLKQWYPRKDSSWTGINCPGMGHDICYNRVSQFWDCISTDNVGLPSTDWESSEHPAQMCIDIYNNDISEAMDDGIEADTLLHNCRVMNNRIINVHSGISAQPSLGGPLYFIRNILYNVSNTPYKLHNYSAGIYLLHNTSCLAGQAFTSNPPYIQNSTIRNNLILGGSGYSLETGTDDYRTTLDYDGWGLTGNENVLKWTNDGGINWGRFPSPAAMSKAMGQEAHGILVDLSIFKKVFFPVDGQTYRADAVDFNLQPGSNAIDAGVIIANINDGYTGAAPDIGALEKDAPRIQYGPRGIREKR